MLLTHDKKDQNAPLLSFSFVQTGFWMSFSISVSFASVYLQAIVAYAKENIGFEDSAKAQSIAFTTTTLGGMLASLIGGVLFDRLSVANTLFVALGVGILGAFIMFLTTAKKRNELRSDDHAIQ